MTTVVAPLPLEGVSGVVTASVAARAGAGASRHRDAALAGLCRLKPVGFAVGGYMGPGRDNREEVDPGRSPAFDVDAAVPQPSGDSIAITSSTFDDMATTTIVFTGRVFLVVEGTPAEVTTALARNAPGFTELTQAGSKDKVLVRQEHIIYAVPGNQEPDRAPDGPERVVMRSVPETMTGHWGDEQERERVR